MSWAVAIGAFGLLVVLRKRAPKIASKGMWFVNAFLAFVGGAAFAETWLGAWIGSLFGGLFGWVGGWVGTSAGIVAGVVVLITAVVVVCDLLDKVADTPAITGLIVLPLLFVVAAGPVAQSGSQLYNAARQMGASSIGQLVGGG